MDEEEKTHFDVIKETKEQAFALLDELRLASIGLNTLTMDKTEERWSIVKENYYIQFKELFLYEFKFLEKFPHLFIES